MITIDKSQIKGVTLLSVEEAKALPRWILAKGKWWWLRSPGHFSDRVASVHYDGSVDDFGDSVYNDYGAVCPALKIENLPNLKIGETIKVLGRMAQYIGNDMVLLVEPIGYRRFDADSNNYDKSEIKAWLEKWLEEAQCGVKMSEVTE